MWAESQPSLPNLLKDPWSLQITHTHWNPTPPGIIIATTNCAQQQKSSNLEQNMKNTCKWNQHEIYTRKMELSSRELTITLAYQVLEKISWDLKWSHSASIYKKKTQNHKKKQRSKIFVFVHRRKKHTWMTKLVSYNNHIPLKSL